MSVLLNVILPVVLVAGLAALVQSRLRLDMRTISRAAFYLFSPALVFDSLSGSNIGGQEFGGIALAFAGLTLAMWAIGEGLSRLLRLDAPTKSGFLLSLLLMNAGNYGLPVVLFAFGEEGLARATLYFTLSGSLSASVGVYIAARGSAPARVALRRILGVPLVYASIAGLAFNLAGVALPEPLAKAVHLLAQASVPVMLVTLGIQLANTARLKERVANVPALATAIAGRLVLSPAIALGMAWLAGLTGLTRDVVVVESAMPTAVMTVILAAEFECGTSFVTLAIFGSTLLSVVTVTGLLNLLM
jgi:hypothetical protein